MPAASSSASPLMVRMWQAYCDKHDGQPWIGAPATVEQAQQELEASEHFEHGGRITPTLKRP